MRVLAGYLPCEWLNKAGDVFPFVLAKTPSEATRVFFYKAFIVGIGNNCQSFDVDAVKSSKLQ
jgi:hypothetical protein